MSSLSAERVLGWLLPVLAILAEGSLLAVVYVAIETAIDHRQPLFGGLEFAVAAGFAAFAVYRGWLDPDGNPVAFLALLGTLGVLGWMWDADVRTLVLAGNPVDAVALHPGGWLMLVAGMRGVGRGVEIDDRAMTRLVLLGVPLLAVPWLAGQLGARELRAVFVEEAFAATLTFVAAGFIAAGLARLQEIRMDTGIDWRHDRSWLGTVLGVLVIVLALGIPASLLLGLSGDAVTRAILDPILALLGYLLVAFVAAAALAAALLAWALGLQRFQLPVPRSPADIAVLHELPANAVDQFRGAITGVAVFWIALMVIGVVLLRAWLRRGRRLAPASATDERSFRIPDGSFGLRWPQVRLRALRLSMHRPHDAVTAYLASLDTIAANLPDAARAQHETPRAHAHRTAIGPELALLQADYALVRYKGRSLTDGEHRRAMQRWRRLRDRLAQP